MVKVKNSPFFHVFILGNIALENLTRYHLHIQLAKNERKREYQQLLFK